MKKSGAVSRGAASAERQLDGFIAKFDADNQKLIRSVRKGLQKRFGGCVEFAYDNYNFFVLGYGPTERPSDAIVSMPASANGVGLCFVRGVGLPDPTGVLRGSGNQTRSVHLDSAAMLARPDIEALIAAAKARSRIPVPGRGLTTLVIRSVSAKQRPRRKEARASGAKASKRRA
jgi:hypothetical protein